MSAAHAQHAGGTPDAFDHEQDPTEARRVPASQGRTVFVGESPPANGTFFYFGNSNLAQCTFDAFGGPRVHGSVTAFLDWFRDNGFYLLDLSRDPVNQLPKSERRQVCKACESQLAMDLLQVHPQAVVCVMKGIAPFVVRSMGSVGLDVPFYTLPFPALGHQREYVSGLSAIRSELPRLSRDR